MHIIDLFIFILYILLMLGVGFFFHRKNKDIDDFYVGGRKMSSMHVGLSVVATDVGGGFSIGLGGLGFVMGISGSWMLFTGLVGAWLSAVFLIPRIKSLSNEKTLYTFPQVFEQFYHPRVAVVAGIISAIGYLGFTSSQLLAGAKLASATFSALSIEMALIIMGFVAVGYTVLGGLKAVIYTDSIQWIILMSGLIFIGIPFSYQSIGGLEGIRQTLPSSFLSLSNLSWQTIVNWFVTIVPIWFVGMTLYQRIYSCRSEREAKRAWYLAGLFEWPIMAFMGVLLGLFARVAFDNGLLVEGGVADISNIDPEMGLPLLLRTILPVGLLGLILSAYFSAILSTADSCLIASSGNFLTDIFQKFLSLKLTQQRTLFLSKIITLIVGIIAVIIAMKMTMVLELMLYSYAFMVAGLLVPVLAIIIQKKPDSLAAFCSMLIG
ncbi:MAG: sodium:solute symporter family protein, partial [Bacteroidia bacterium]|nr:sodium:solute symporter family protein [Bacteroidia bacterium]